MPLYLLTSRHANPPHQPDAGAPPLARLEMLCLALQTLTSRHTTLQPGAGRNVHTTLTPLPLGRSLTHTHPGAGRNVRGDGGTDQEPHQDRDQGVGARREGAQGRRGTPSPFLSEPFCTLSSLKGPHHHTHTHTHPHTHTHTTHTQHTHTRTHPHTHTHTHTHTRTHTYAHAHTHTHAHTHHITSAGLGHRVGGPAAPVRLAPDHLRGPEAAAEKARGPHTHRVRRGQGAGGRGQGAGGRGQGAGGTGQGEIGRAHV